jgi:hypothetical protein
MSKLSVKMDATRECNKAAHEDIVNAGRPAATGRFSYDPLVIWGVSETEIDEFIAAAQLEAKRARWWTRSGRRRRHNAWRAEMAWECRRAALSGCEVVWG